MSASKIEHDDESPELTDELVASMRPAGEVLDGALYKALIGSSADQFRYQIYRAREEFRWRLQGPNGEILAESAESYHAIDDARAAIQVVQRAVATKPDISAAA